MPVNVQAMIDKYGRGVAGGGTNYRTGVTGKGNTWKNNAGSDAAENNYARGVQRAAAEKARQKAIASKSASDWESAAVNVGAGNYTASAERAKANYTKQAQNVAAAADAAEAAAAAIPRGSIEENFNRSRAAGVAIHRHWAGVKGLTPEV